MAQLTEEVFNPLEDCEVDFEGEITVSAESEAIFSGNKCFLGIGDRLLLQDSKITLLRGHCYGLIGENGAGKTSLLRAIYGYMENELKDTSSLSFSYVGQSSVEELENESLNPYQIVVEGATIARNLEFQLDNCSTDDIERIMEEIADLETPQRKERGLEALRALGFTKTFARCPTKSLSGGWRTRLCLAFALSRHPNVLLLDEPTNHLDLHAVLGIVSLLRKLSQENTTIVVVSHDAAFLDLVCTDMMSLHQTFLQTTPGNYSVFEERAGEYRRFHEHLYDKRCKEESRVKSSVQKMRQVAASSGNSKAIKQAASREKKAADRIGLYREDGKRFKTNSLKFLDAKWVRLPAKAEAVQVNKELSFKIPACAISDDRADTTSCLMSLDHVSLAYEGEKQNVIENVTFRISSRDRIGLVGRNGSGKSTLMTALASQSTLRSVPESNVRVTKGSMDGRCSIAIVDQNQLTTLENYLSDTPISFLTKRHHDLFQKQEVRKQLAGFGMTGELAVTPIGVLSGGLRVRLLCDILCADVIPDILLLDEPTNHLDAETTVALANALKSFSGAVITVSHNCAFLLQVCRDLWIVHPKKNMPSTLSIQCESSPGDFATFFESFAKTILKPEDHYALQEMLTVRAVRQSVVIQTPGSQTSLLV